MLYGKTLLIFLCFFLTLSSKSSTSQSCPERRLREILSNLQRQGPSGKRPEAIFSEIRSLVNNPSLTQEQRSEVVFGLLVKTEFTDQDLDHLKNITLPYIADYFKWTLSLDRVETLINKWGNSAKAQEVLSSILQETVSAEISTGSAYHFLSALPLENRLDELVILKKVNETSQPQPILYSPKIEGITRLKVFGPTADRRLSSYISISPFLRNVRHLELRDIPLNRDALKDLQRNGLLERLESLSLISAGIQDQDFSEIALLAKNLKYLDLSVNEIGEESLGAITKSSAFRGLTHLKLENNPLGDESMTKLSHALSSRKTPLIELNLSTCDLTDQFLEGDGAAQAFFSNVQSLILNFNDISDQGPIYALSKVDGLDKSHSLSSLSLKGTLLTGVGVQALTTAPLFGGLRALDLSLNQFPPEVLKIILAAKHRNPTLKVYFSENEFSPPLTTAQEKLVRESSPLFILTPDIGL